MLVFIYLYCSNDRIDMKHKHIIMPKINQKNIYFFEVEDQDKEKVLSEFPDAKIFKEPFSDKVIDKCKDAEILCGMIYSEFKGENLEKLPNLKMIATRTVGYDHIDLKWADEKDIPVCNVPDYGSHVIAEHVFALLLASIRNVLEGEAKTEKEEFSWKGLRGIALKGKTLGVVGTGKIGMHVCRIASLGFLMNVIAYDKYPDTDRAMDYHFTYVDSLEDIWEKSDIISLHVPFFPETKHMINKETIAKMKDNVVLINTARGGLINTPDLIQAIKDGKFLDVALDVLEHEDNIKENDELIHLPGVIITPHIAFYADDSMSKMFSEAIASIKRFVDEEKLVHQVHGQ